MDRAPGGDRASALAEAHDLINRQEWAQARERLLEADALGALGAEELEVLGRAAYLLGLDDDYVAALERAHETHLSEGDVALAARCGCWIGINLMLRGEHSRGAGWFARAERILDQAALDCVERGYLMIPALLGTLEAGDDDDALEIATAVTGIAERFEDRDLLVLGRMEQAHALVRVGREGEGRRQLDELLVAVTSDRLSPVVTGIAYCNTILFCAGTYDLARAREWTAAMERWCHRQSQMVAHTGVCQVHHAELLELCGSWPEALLAAQRAERRSDEGVMNSAVAGHALYCRAEVQRKLGEFDAADQLFAEAATRGRPPHPGLARLRAAQGKAEGAAAAIRVALAEAQGAMTRASVLPAVVELMLAVGDLTAARAASTELDSIALGRQSPMLAAMAAQARGAVSLADGNPQDALGSLRLAWRTWQELDVPYESARVRVLVGLACRSLGDEDTAQLELGIAQSAFDALGAAPDAARVSALMSPPRPNHGLTAREVEILQLVARGLTNRAIGDVLTISERTVDRHVSNILTKTGVPSRSAATAYAYEHELL